MNCLLLSLYVLTGGAPRKISSALAIDAPKAKVARTVDEYNMMMGQMGIRYNASRETEKCFYEQKKGGSTSHPRKSTHTIH
mmetsp:Transcript_33847/g.70359  ORF Transcript_33847/g.70359 Transcript_33847/m.70359 type:complete len:81 (+) Transcript_33847:1701-1943(+)